MRILINGKDSQMVKVICRVCLREGEVVDFLWAIGQQKNAEAICAKCYEKGKIVPLELVE